MGFALVWVLLVRVHIRVSFFCSSDSRAEVGTNLILILILISLLIRTLEPLGGSESLYGLAWFGSV